MIYENLTCVCDRAREIIWEWLQANDIWLSTSFPGPSCRKERQRTTVFYSGRGTPLLQCAEENGTYECRRCSCHYVFSICRHLAILLWTYVLMYAAGKSRTKTVQGKTIQGKLCFFRSSGTRISILIRTLLCSFKIFFSWVIFTVVLLLLYIFPSFINNWTRPGHWILGCKTLGNCEKSLEQLTNRKS